MWKLAVLLSGAALALMTVPALFLTVATSDSGVETVSGTVRFTEGEVELPLGSYVEVVLVDVFGESSTARPLGRTLIENADGLPAEFRIAYDADRLTTDAILELWVAVRHDGELLYTAASDYFVDVDRSVSDIEVAVAPLAMP